MPLKEQQVFFSELLNHLNADIAVFDRNHRYIYINQYALRNPEFRKWIIGKTDFEYCAYRKRDNAIALKRSMLFKQVMEEKKELEWEETIVNDEGKKTIHLRRLSPLMDKNGKVNFVIGYGIDITERKQVEEALVQSKEFNRQIIHNSPHLIFVKDAKGKFVLVNQAVARAFGKPIEEIENRLNHDIHDNKQETDSYSSIDKLVIEQLKEVKVEETFTLPDGTVRWYDTIKVPLVQADGEVQVLGISTDVTQRKLTEEKLQRNELRMKEVQRMARFGNWDFDLLTQQINWSDELFRIFGLPSGSPPPTYDEFLSFIHPDDLSALMNGIEKAITRGEPYQVDYRIILKNGQEKIVNTIGEPFIDAKGIVVKLFGTAIEVTDRKKAEEELLAAKKQAEESARIKEYFLANVSHELRTPINGILGMSGLLYKTKIDSIQRNYIDILRTTAEHLLIIVNDILDYSKIESGKLTIEKISFDFKKAVHTAVQTQLYKAEEKDLALNLFVDHLELPALIGDPYRLNQILLNLLSNAIKFTEQGKIDIQCSIINETEKIIEIEFSIKDTGIGIPADRMDYIFESFTQANSSISRQYGGSGLGLAICKDLVELQGGRIWVYSTLGAGSDFRFVIPYQKSKHQDIKDHSLSNLEFSRLGKLRILLAEDNNVNQFITESMLQDWGFVVDTAVNGREAVSLMSQYYYDLVLMDIQMPELTGIEATHIIRKMNDKHKSQIPIIALTANTSKVMHKKYVAEGMSDFLIKPYKEATLFAKIASHIVNSDPEKLKTLQQPRFPARKKPQSVKSSLYDLSMLHHDAHQNPAFINRMLGIFIETIPEIVQQMKRHLDKNEIESICSLAHKIKPTIDGAGIISLRDTIRNIENYRDKKRTRDQLAVDLAKLEEVINEVTGLFREEIIKLNKQPN